MAVTIESGGSEFPPPVVELASGIDAFYLSGRVPLREADVDELSRRRSDAAESGEAVPVVLGGEEFGLQPRSLGKYKFRLSHPNGEIGITTSEHLPQLRVQPKAVMLHGLGVERAFHWFRQICESGLGPVQWSVSRMDLFCDVLGWSLEGDERELFKCRATHRVLDEEGGAFGSVRFGQRSTGTVLARIYDKTAQIQAKGLDYWYDIWGSAWDAESIVLRVEFEIGRQGLCEFGVDAPEDALAQAPGMWGALTEQWLTFRERSGDGTESRWPVAGEWEAVQRASLRGAAIGLERAHRRHERGNIRVLLPAFIGYLANVSERCGATTLDEALAVARSLVREDEGRRDIIFEHRLEMLSNERRFG